MLVFLTILIEVIWKNWLDEKKDRWTDLTWGVLDVVMDKL